MIVSNITIYFNKDHKLLYKFSQNLVKINKKNYESKTLNNYFTFIVF